MESKNSPENLVFTRDQVVDAFRKFPARGITNPGDLPVGDSDVISADALLQVWDNQQKLSLKTGDKAAELEYTLDRTTIYVDAGFSDPDYLDEVANDWLDQDLVAAEEAGLVEIEKKIQAKIDEINGKLEK